MKKIPVIILVLLLVLPVLLSCSKTKLDTPAGMKLASVSAADYYLYVPEEWEIASQDGITAAYVSVLDSSNVSCARYSVTNEAVFDTAGSEEKAEVVYAKNFWIDYLAQLKLVMPGFAVISEPEATVLDGHAAVKCSYSAVMSGKNYDFDMVICIKDKLYAYLLTFTAEEANYEADAPYFEKIVSEFRFQTGQFE